MEGWAPFRVGSRNVFGVSVIESSSKLTLKNWTLTLNYLVVYENEFSMRFIFILFNDTIKHYSSTTSDLSATFS